MNTSNSPAIISKFKIKEASVYLLSVLLISPSFIWVMLDKTIWKPDQAWYGRLSINLFYALAHEPTNWLNEMVGTFGFETKAPGIAWFGQFFVPIGYLVGSIESGFLISVLVTQALSLVLMYRTIQELSSEKPFAPLAGCVIVASAPLFVGMSHQYLVEPMQMLAVIWFILIMSFAPKWNRVFIFSQLLAATAFATLAKASSPMYCIGPGLVALRYIFWPKPTQNLNVWWQKRTISALVCGIALTIATISWYYQNLERVMQHISIASSGPVAELFGKSDTFLNTLIYWLGATQRNFFAPVVLALSALVFVGGLVYYFINHTTRMKHFTLCGGAALLQIIVVLSIFSLSANRENRYLLPLLPYFSLLICWGLIQVNKLPLTGLVIAVFAAQLVMIYGQVLAIVPPNPRLSPWIHPINRDPHHRAMILNSIISRTCTKASKGRYNIIGVDLSWLNTNAASFFASKKRLQDGLWCNYISFGFAESDPDRAEAFIRSFNPVYYITVDPDLYPIPPSIWNQVSVPMLERVRASALMKLEPPLVDDPRILIFRRVDE